MSKQSARRQTTPPASALNRKLNVIAAQRITYGPDTHVEGYPGPLALCWACGKALSFEALRDHLDAHLQDGESSAEVKQDAQTQLDWVLNELKVRILSAQGRSSLLQEPPRLFPWERIPPKRQKTPKRTMATIPDRPRKEFPASRAQERSSPPSPQRRSPLDYRVRPPKKEEDPGSAAARVISILETPLEVWESEGSSLSRGQKEVLIRWLEAKGTPWKRTVDEVPASIVQMVTGAAADAPSALEVKQFLMHAIDAYRNALRQESEW